MEPHSPVKYKGYPWSVCKKCGLVYLRNDLTQWRIAKGCDYDEEQFRKMVRKLA